MAHTNAFLDKQWWCLQTDDFGNPKSLTNKISGNVVICKIFLPNPCSEHFKNDWNKSSSFLIYWLHLNPGVLSRIIKLFGANMLCLHSMVDLKPYSFYLRKVYGKTRLYGTYSSFLCNLQRLLSHVQQKWWHFILGSNELLWLQKFCS